MMLEEIKLEGTTYIYKPDSMSKAVYKVLLNTKKLFNELGFNMDDIDTIEQDSMYYNLKAINKIYKKYNEKHR